MVNIIVPADLIPIDARNNQWWTAKKLVNSRICGVAKTAWPWRMRIPPVASLCDSHSGLTFLKRMKSCWFLSKWSMNPFSFCANNQSFMSESNKYQIQWYVWASLPWYIAKWKMASVTHKNSKISQNRRRTSSLSRFCENIQYICASKFNKIINIYYYRWLFWVSNWNRIIIIIVVLKTICK